jgi:hypothetical protein
MSRLPFNISKEATVSIVYIYIYSTEANRGTFTFHVSTGFVNLKINMILLSIDLN